MMKNVLLTLPSECGIIYNEEKLFKIYNITINKVVFWHKSDIKPTYVEVITL